MRQTRPLHLLITRDCFSEPAAHLQPQLVSRAAPPLRVSSESLRIARVDSLTFLVPSAECDRLLHVCVSAHRFGGDHVRRLRTLSLDPPHVALAHFDQLKDVWTLALARLDR